MHEPNLIHNMCTVQVDTEPTIQPSIQTDFETLLEEAGPPPPLLSQEKSLSVKVSETLTVCVWKTDLTSFTVDAIVNAANKSLGHTGGLALALATAGGPNITKESDSHIQKYGKLKPGEAVVTSAGNLPRRYLIHAVGPQIGNNPSSQTLSKAQKALKKTIESILNRVIEHHIKSVAIPAISSGIFRFPLALCADTIVSTVKEFHQLFNIKHYFHIDIPCVLIHYMFFIGVTWGLEKSPLEKMTGGQSDGGD
uniref:Macro domain-containing protein n=1 Tax=Acanthochromis polyacanthus TaxID=80966 RepID=A0A3Q1GV20_9TELE